MAKTRATSELQMPGDDRQQRARAFRKAKSHSRRVLGAKAAIIIGCVVGVSGLVLATLFDPFRSLPAGASVGAVKLNGSRVTMDLPKLAGFRKDGRPYQVRAASATQDIKRPNVLDLVDLDADVGMGASGNAKITAKTGIYDTAREIMTLKTDVRLKTESGYDVLLSVADIDFKAGSVISKEKVRVLMSGATVDADAMAVADNGKLLTFNGNVRTVFESAASRNEAAKSLKGTAQ